MSRFLWFTVYMHNLGCRLLRGSEVNNTGVRLPSRSSICKCATPPPNSLSTQSSRSETVFPASL